MCFLSCMLLILWYSSALSPAGMLRRNYRSHPRLIELSSRMFYQDRLIASADPAKVRAPAWSELQRDSAGAGRIFSKSLICSCCQQVNRSCPSPFPAVNTLQCNGQDSGRLPGPVCAGQAAFPSSMQLCKPACGELQQSTTPCLQGGRLDAA